MKLCKICDEEVKRLSATYCSRKCANSDPDKIEKTKQNNIKKYGVPSVFSVKNVQDKTKQTMLDRYGVKHNLQTGSICREKSKKTLLINYGVEYPLQSAIIRNRTKKTNLRKYGVENPQQVDTIKKQTKLTNLERYGVENPLLSNSIQKKIRQTTIKKYGTKYHTQSHNKEAFNKLSNFDWLFDQYVNKKKTTNAIADELGNITANVVGIYLNKHNIDTRPTQRYSYECIRWLENIMKESDLFIQHALNLGEYRIPNMNLTVDGYCRGTNTIYEFYGDIWHGNPKLYKDDEFCHPFYTDISAGELYRKTLDREKLLKELGYNLKTIWEDEWLIKNK